MKLAQKDVIQGVMLIVEFVHVIAKLVTVVMK